MEWVLGDDGRWRQLVNGVLSTSSWSEAGVRRRSDFPQELLQKQQNDEEVNTMDLGLGGLATDLLRQAGTAYINREFGPQPTGFVPTTPTLFDNAPDLLPGVDVISQSPGPGWVYKQVCGQWKWVRKRRKRCKNLITPTQANQLQQIITMCGKNSELTKLIVAKGGLC